MTKCKKVNQIIKQFLCCVPSNIIRQVANLSVGQVSPWTAALAIWKGYHVYIYCGLQYYIRLRITTTSSCTPVVIFDSDPTSTAVWKYYTYKLKDVMLTNTGYMYGCCKGQSVCVSLGIKIDGCGNPIPGNTA